MNRALAVATRVICMLEGKMVLDLAARAVSREQIVEAYLGFSRGTGGRS